MRCIILAGDKWPPASLFQNGSWVKVAVVTGWPDRSCHLSPRPTLASVESEIIIRPRMIWNDSNACVRKGKKIAARVCVLCGFECMLYGWFDMQECMATSLRGFVVHRYVGIRVRGCQKKNYYQS